MHDVLAHSLSGLMLQLEGARMLAAGNPADPRLLLGGTLTAGPTPTGFRVELGVPA